MVVLRATSDRAASPALQFASALEVGGVTSLTVSGVFQIEQSFAECFVIFSKPSAPTLVIERKHTALQQPFGTRPEVISVPEERIRLAEIRDDDPASAILIHSLLDHHKRIRGQIAAAAGIIQFGCVVEAVNSRIGSFEQKVPVT
jgi:hypothetical protein